MTPAVKAFVESLIDHYETRITELEGKIQKLTPQNSSRPPSTQHPHAKPKRPKGDGKKNKRGGQKGHKKHQRDLIPPEQCDNLIDQTGKERYGHREWLWTFVDTRGIEPTNNTAERALRPAVIYRKLSFGTQSELGSRFIERMLTVSETCRLQNRSPYDYLTKAVTAYFSKQAAPSLLPNLQTVTSSS